jgi:hypothetical protein
MGMIAKLTARLKQAKAARQSRARKLEAQARQLLAENGRIGALKALDNLRTRAIGRRAEQNRIADLVTTIFRLTPSSMRAKAAKRMFQHVLAHDMAPESSADVATRVRETIHPDPLTETLAKAVGALRVEGPDEFGGVIVFLTSASGNVIAHQVGQAGVHASADAWLAWRDELA